MIKIKNTPNGIDATVKGFNTKEISDQIQACTEGNCECACDPEIMARIDDIKITENGDETNIIITGKELDADVIAPMMQECLIAKK